MKNKTINVVELFEKNELDISNLYALYSEKIPEGKTFWAKLSQEEVRHAEDIRKNHKKDKNLISENELGMEIINYISGFIRKKTKEAGKKKVSHAEALEVALRVEQSFVENKCFEIFSPIDKSLREVFEKLNEETEKHVNLLREEIGRMMKRQN